MDCGNMREFKADREVGAPEFHGVAWQDGALTVTPRTSARFWSASALPRQFEPFVAGATKGSV